MCEIQRFDYIEYETGKWRIKADDDGEYVLYSDHCAAMEACNKSTREICAYFEQKLAELDKALADLLLLYDRVYKERDALRKELNDWPKEATP